MIFLIPPTSISLHINWDKSGTILDLLRMEYSESILINFVFSKLILLILTKLSAFLHVAWFNHWVRRELQEESNKLERIGCWRLSWRQASILSITWEIYIKPISVIINQDCPFFWFTFFWIIQVKQNHR